MTILRRLNLLLSCVLALVLSAGSVLPPPLLWECRHAARVIAAGVATRSAMPCQMDAAPMPHMACCPASIKPFFFKPSSHQASVAPPACHPVLTCLTVPTAAGAPNPLSSLRRSLAPAPAILPLFASCLPSVPDTLALRRRPPPTFSLPLFAFKHTPGLRAPPAA